MAEYEKPDVEDFGSLTELTKAQGFFGPEDGGMKVELIVPHHSAPAAPPSP